LINDSDCIAQSQELIRGGKVVRVRLVKIYWEKDGFIHPEPIGKKGTWDLSEFDRHTDVLVTKFHFYGRGKHLWTTVPQNGVIQYPGITSELDEPGSEISCSPIEFHEILTEAGKLKRDGKEIKSNLTLTVFGQVHRAK